MNISKAHRGKLKFQDIAHYYIGCEIIDEHAAGKTFRLTGELYQCIKIGDSWAAIKPVLRPIASITDEEAIEWFHLQFPEKNPTPVVNRILQKHPDAHYCVQVHRDFDLNFQSIAIPKNGYSQYQPEELHWFISKRFNVFNLDNSEFFEKGVPSA